MKMVEGLDEKTNEELNNVPQFDVYKMKVFIDNAKSLYSNLTNDHYVFSKEGFHNECLPYFEILGENIFIRFCGEDSFYRKVISNISGSIGVNFLENVKRMRSISKDVFELCLDVTPSIIGSIQEEVNRDVDYINKILDSSIKDEDIGNLRKLGYIGDICGDGNHMNRAIVDFYNVSDANKLVQSLRLFSNTANNLYNEVHDVAYFFSRVDSLFERDFKAIYIPNCGSDIYNISGVSKGKAESLLRKSHIEGQL